MIDQLSDLLINQLIMSALLLLFSKSMLKKVVNHCYLFYVHLLHSVTCCLFIHPTLHLSTSSPSLLLNLPLLKLKSISKLCPFHVPLQPSIMSKWSLRSKHEVNLFVFCHDEYFMDCLSGFSYIIWDSLDSNFCTFFTKGSFEGFLRSLLPGLELNCVLGVSVHMWHF